MRFGFMAALAIVATAAIASPASAEVVAPEVVKPQVVIPHEVTAPAEDRSTPAEAPAPEASVGAEDAPEVALSEGPADGDYVQPAVADKAELPVGDRGGRQNFPGTDPETISEVNFNNALFLVYAVTGMLSPISQQTLIQESISVVRSSSILLGGEPGGGPAGKRTDDEPEKSDQ